MRGNMTTAEAMASRLNNQQLKHTQFEKVEDLVNWMGMMQAQDYRQFRWAIGIRMKTPDAEAIKNSFSAGSIVRLHLLRCTIQAVSAQDYHWILDLCKERNLSTIKSWPSYNKTTFSEQYHKEATAALKDILSSKRSLTKRLIGEEMAKLGLPADIAHLNQVILRGEIEGLLVSGDMKGTEATWALANMKLKNVDAHPHTPKDKALTTLARKYFQSHSPASLEDFCWWTGLPVSQNKEAIQLIAKELEEVGIGRQSMFLYKQGHGVGNVTENHSQDAKDKSVLFLPPYDEYLIGYKSRWISIKKEHESKTHNNLGTFHPVVLYNGEIVGNWRMSMPKKTISIDTDIFSRKQEIGERRLVEAQSALRNFYNRQD